MSTISTVVHTWSTLITTEDSYTLATGGIVYSELKFYEEIGKGGFGTVWKGEWIPGEKVVAIKKVQTIVEREVSCIVVHHLPSLVNLAPTDWSSTSSAREKMGRCYPQE